MVISLLLSYIHNIYIYIYIYKDIYIDMYIDIYIYIYIFIFIYIYIYNMKAEFETYLFIYKIYRSMD